MNREILFRGKDIISGEWITGFLVDARHIGCWVVANPVRPETVGQFTGLFDKNGKRIFEGDIVRIPDSKMMGLPAPVAYFPHGATFMIRRTGYRPITLWDAEETIEVIGNIHDNPELLEGGVENAAD